jgi:hypothetical protein
MKNNNNLRTIKNTIGSTQIEQDNVIYKVTTYRNNNSVIYKVQHTEITIL